MPDRNPDDSPGATHAAIGTGHTREEMLRHQPPAGLKRWGIIALVVAIVIAAIGIGLRFFHSESTKSWTDNQAVQTVQVLKLKDGTHGAVLNLPGDIQAFTNAPINAQVTGYVKKWYVDIGAPVKKGRLLAELDTPDLDGQVQQGRANLVNAQAAQKLSAATALRWDALFQQGAVARQDKDEKDADLAAKNASVAASRAALYSLNSQEGFKRLVAPFDGIVTSRAVDVGALVTTGTSATPLFTVADQSKLRIYVRVPQNFAAAIKPGMQATFTVPQYPGRVFTAGLVASAGAVVSSTNSVLVQFGIDNSDGALQPGSYAAVQFPLPAGINGLRIPATALIFRDAGMLVALEDSTGHARMKKIIIQSDDGASVEASGVTSQDRIIDNPPDSLQDGDPVRVAGK